MTTSVYGYWQARHKQPHDECKDRILPFEHWDHPQAGLWKINIGGGYKDGVKRPKKFVPMQIWWQTLSGEVSHEWRDGLILGGLIDGEPATSDQLAGRWIGAEHLTKKAKDAYFAAGKQWPDDAPAGPGHNSQDLESFEDMSRAIMGEVAEIMNEIQRKPIKGLEDANRYENWRDRIAKLGKKADERRRELKKPHDDAAKAVDSEWFPIVRAAEKCSVTVKEVCDTWAKAEEKRIREEKIAEARAKFEAEQKAAEEKRAAEIAEFQRIEAERERMMEDDPIAAITGSMPELPLEPEPLPEPVEFKPVVEAPKILMGTTGTRRSARAEKATATIINLKAAAEYYAAQQHPDLIKLIQKLADAAAKSRATVPGIQMSWQKDAAE